VQAIARKYIFFLFIRFALPDCILSVPDPSVLLPGDDIFGQFVRFFYTLFRVHPFSGQTHLPNGEFEVTHGDAHIDPLHVGQIKECRVSVTITARALQIKMPFCAISNYAPGLFV